MNKWRYTENKSDEMKPEGYWLSLISKTFSRQSHLGFKAKRKKPPVNLSCNGNFLKSNLDEKLQVTGHTATVNLQ